MPHHGFFGLFSYLGSAVRPQLLTLFPLFFLSYIESKSSRSQFLPVCCLRATLLWVPIALCALVSMLLSVHVLNSRDLCEKWPGYEKALHSNWERTGKCGLSQEENALRLQIDRHCVNKLDWLGKQKKPWERIHTSKGQNLLGYV